MKEFQLLRSIKKSGMETLTGGRSQAEDKSWDLCRYECYAILSCRGKRSEEYDKLQEMQEKFMKKWQKGVTMAECNAKIGVGYDTMSG